MTMFRNLAAAGALASLTAALPAAATTYTISELLGAQRSAYTSFTTSGINEQGQIVGHGFLSGAVTEALVWDGGTAQRIHPIGAISSVARGINESGLIIGTATYDGGVTRAFTYDLATAQFSDPFGAGSMGYGINDSGQLVGSLGNAPVFYDPVAGVSTYALPSGTAKASFRAITNSGTIIATRDSGDGHRDVVALSNAGAVLPLTSIDLVRNLDFVAANNNGQYSANFTFPGSPFFINFVGVFNADGSPNPAGLGRLPFDDANYGGAFNDALDFVGESYSENRYGGLYGDAIITTISGGTVQLSSLVTNLGSAFLQQGALINNAGTIVAFGYLDNRRATFVLTPDVITGSVPEPGTWVMLLAGFGLVGAMLRRRDALAPTT